MILKNHTSAPIRKERLSPTSKAKWEASRNKFVEKGGMLDRVENLRKFDNTKNRSRAWLEFINPYKMDGKEQNLIKCRPSKINAALVGREWS